MIDNTYKIIISPENIQSDIFQTTYDGVTVGAYSSMTQVLASGILTGMTIPILLTENTIDLGYYSVFDGAIYQKDSVQNFIFSATSADSYTYSVYNTSSDINKFTELASYTIDWGDGSQTTSVTNFSPNYVQHLYPTVPEPSGVTITMTQVTPFGTNTIKKNIVIPYTGITIDNPNGTAYFTPNVGAWTATPISYDFIFSGDSVNTIESEVSSNYTTVPFPISGYTTSKITELANYGSTKYDVGLKYVNDILIGEISAMVPGSTGYTAYTVNDIDYYDYSDGTTVFVVQSSGFTQNDLVAEPIVKDESLIGIVSPPEIQSDVFMERGKNSAMERLQRLGEVNNVEALTRYGYGFFNIVNK
jgi:hypothetical protein